MGENKLRIALDSGESMFARHILPQLVTKLAIGLGALFLVGVLLAAIPNHRAPVVTGASTQSQQELQGTNHPTAPAVNLDEAKSSEKDTVRDVAHRHETRPMADDTTR